MTDSLRSKFAYVARLNKALKIRSALERAAATRRDYGPARMLAAALEYGDPEWEIVCRWAGVRSASADTRALVLQLLRERVAEVAA